MRLEGHTAITEALTEAAIPAAVEPTPQDGEDVRYIDIRTNETANFSDVLNALGRAGLMLREGPADAGFRRGPQLTVIASELRTVAGRDSRPLEPKARFITLEDHNIR